MPSKRKAVATSTASDADHGTDASPPSSSIAAVVAAPVKRQRVSRACDQCRAAREKCDGIQPLCFPCVSQNRACTYAANPKKRGVQTGYIKTLEVALAWLFDKVPGCEEALETLLLHEGGQGQNLLVGKDSDKANRLHKTWRRSKIHKEIDRILSGGLVSQSRADKSSPSDDGESDNDQSETASRTLPASTPRGALQPPNGPSTRHPDGHGSIDSQFNNINNNSNIISLPSNHWRLLDIYFSYTHCWYPILEKQDLLKTVYLYPEGGMDINHMEPSSAAHAELWAAMALASYQDASSMSASAPGIGPGPGPAEDSAWSLDDIYRIARRLVPSEEGEFKIQHARALLLLALINVGRGKKTSAWILVGLAHRIALDVSELHRGDERSARRATAVLMGCYILDTLIAVHPRAMPSLETAGIVEGMSIPEDDLDEWQSWAPCDGFGTGASPRTSSRSPAYSLTTFNQLYDVFKFMRKRTLQRHNGLLSVEHPSEAILLLHQTIKPGLPFAGFIVARDSSSVGIPSAYVLRILFLWVDAILDSTDESPCNLILESVEQYINQFGACGAPPFFASCLAMVRQHQSFNNLHPQCVERWQVIQDTLASIWNPSRQRKSADRIRSLSAVSKTPIAAADTPLATALNHNAPSVTTSTPSDLYSSSSLHTPPLLNQHFPIRKPQPPPPPPTAPFMMNALSPPKAVHNTAAAINPALASAGMNMLDRQSIMQGGSGPPHQHQHQQHQQHQPPPPPSQPMHGPGGGLIHRDSFNAGPLDYDALLDDLSSMDYIDRVDADPQFMANLGFAPGCDISEVLSREFGAI